MSTNDDRRNAIDEIIGAAEYDRYDDVKTVTDDDDSWTVTDG